MKQVLKKATAATLSLLMAFGPNLSYAYAAESANQLAEMAYTIDADGNVTDSDGNPVDLDSILAGEASATADEADDDAVQTLSFSEMVEYLYIESGLVAGGETQNIVVGVGDALSGRTVVSAMLELVNTDTGAVVEAVAQSNSDGAYLFTYTFADDEAGAYALQKLTFACEDATYSCDVTTAELTAVTVDEDDNIQVDGEVESFETATTESGQAYYSFDVVRADTAAALLAANTVSEDDEYAAYVVNSDGTLSAAASLEAAIEASGSDTEGAVTDDEPAAGLSDAEFDAGLQAAAETQKARDAAGQTSVSDAVLSGIDNGDVEAPANDEGTTGTEAAVAAEESAQAEATDDSSEIVATADDGTTVAETASSATAESEAEGEDGLNPFLRFLMNLWSGIVGFFTAVFAPTTAYAAVSNAREAYLIVAIDPGHGGTDGGASGNGLNEKTLTLNISNYVREKLSTYTGVTTYMTRATDAYVGLQARVDNAVAVGSDVFVSVHINSASASSANGVEVYVPNNSSYLKDSVATPGQQLGAKVQANLVALGFYNRGTKYDTYDYNGTKLYYSDGSPADAFAVIRYSRAAGIPGILVECGFISNASDAAKLASATYLKSMGNAIADGVVSQYGLETSASAKSIATVGTSVNVKNLGWLNQVYDQKVAGTTGKSFAMYGVMLRLQNSAASGSSISYRVNTGSGWQSWASDGAVAGSSSWNTPVQAIQIKLTGTAASNYDVYYRAHVADYGWLGWTKNGASAGTSGYDLRMEAIQVVLLAKGSAAPGSTDNAYRDANATSSTGTVSLTLSAPTANATTVAKGSTITWTKNVSGDTTGATYTYLYRRGTTGTINTVSTPSLLAASGGMYQVAVRATQNGATVDSAWTTVTVTSEAIMGSSVATADQVKAYWKSVWSGKTYPYSDSTDAPTLDAFIDLAYAQAAKEGVRGDVVLAQIAIETGWLQFGGDVKASQYNFGGIGATGNGNSGNSFSSVTEGLMVNVQHLKAYGSTAALNTTCVDPRFKYVTRGVAPYVEQLAGRWAGDLNYGISIDSVLSRYYAM